MKELLVIFFSGIFTSIILPSEFSDSEENLRNSPPEIQQIGNQTVTEDQTFIYNVIVSDDDNDLIQYFLNIDGNGNESINQQGLLTIVPNLNFNGIIQVEVIVSDGTETDSEIFNLEVTEVNDDPILEFINNVSYLEDESQMITVNATDIDSNDLFYNCNPISANINCSVNQNNITFTSPQNFNGTESVNISVSDIQGGSDSQIVQVSVIAVNDNPILENIDNVSFIEDQSVIINISANDIDGDNLSYGCNSLGNINCNVNGSQLTLSSSANYFGTESIEIFVQDGNGGSDTQNINVTVTPDNDAPVLDFIPNLSYQEDENPEIIILSATDIEDDFLTYACNPQGNNIGCSINGSQLTVFFPENYNGSEIITITVSDSNLSDSQDVTVTVNSVNDSVQLIQNINDISVNEDSNAITIDLSNHFDDIEDGPNLSYSLINLGDLETVISTSFIGTDLTISFNTNKHGLGNPILRACDSSLDCYEEQFQIVVISINDQPNLNNIPAPPSTIVINREYSFLIDPSSADVDDIQFDFSIASQPGGGNSSIETTANNQYANFLWYPNTLGNFSITIKLIDFNSENGVNGTQQDTYTWNVEVIDANNNNPPEIANIDNQNVDEDGVFILSLDITDVDDNIADLNVNVYDEYTQHISYGTSLEANFINGEWVLSITPEADWNGDVNVIVSVSDQSNSSSKEFLLTVNPINDTPSFEFIDDCEIQFNEDSSIVYDLYISDIDSHEYYNVNPQQTISYILTPVGNEISGDILNDQILFQNETNFYDESNDLNQMTFISIEDFKGTQVFNLTLTDDSGTSNDTYSQDFIVCVNNINDPPILDFIDNLSFDEDTISSTLVVNAVDDVVNPLYSDSDINSFFYECNPYGVNVGCEVNGTDIIFSNITEHFFGSADFQIVANDGDGGQDSQDITVTVNPINDAPVSNDFSTSTSEDTPSTFSLSATDIENYDLTYYLIENGFAPANGSIINNNDGTVTYNPNQDFNGIDSLFFKVEDNDIDSNNNLESNEARVLITINPVNDPPVLSLDNLTSFSFDEDEVDVSLRTFSVDVSDIDLEDEFSFTCNPLGFNLSCDVEIVDSTPVDGGQANIIVTSPLNFNTLNGLETVEITVFDGSGGQDSQTVEITVNPVNDAPTAIDSAESTDEDTQVIISFNGEDVDDDDLNYNIIDITINGLIVNNNDGTATYTPNAEFNGEDSFTYIANDGFLDSEEPPAVVTITVQSVNDNPVLDEIGDLDFDEDIPYTLNVNALDVDEDDLTYLCNTITPNIICDVNGTEITLSAPEHYNGDESVEIIVTDGFGGQDSEVVNVTIDPVNDAPTVIDSTESTDEDTQVTISFNGEDVDGDELTYTILEQTQNGLIVNNNDGTATYTPNAEFNGEDSFTYIANDGFLDSEEPPAVVIITVLPKDDPPVLGLVENNSFLEDENLVFNVSATDLEDDNDDLVFSCVTGENLICEVEDNQLTISAPLNYNGIESLEIIVTDSSSNSDSQLIEISVIPVNDPPELSNMEEQTDEEVALSISLAGTDIDGDNPLFYSILNSPDNGLIILNTDTLLVFPTELIENGNIIYRPNDNFSGIDSFTYIVNDGLLDSENSAVVNIEVVSTNDPPITDDVSVTVLEGQSVTESFDIFDSDGDELIVEIISGPFEDGSDVTININNTFTYQAPNNDTGDPGDVFQYKCLDNFGAESNISNVFITILPSNDPPILDNIPPLIMDEDDPQTITVSASDEEGHEIIFYCNSGENIICDVDENDSSQITFSSAVEHWNGNETLIIYAIDENSAGGVDVDVSSQEFEVVIQPINDTIETIEVTEQINEDDTLTVNLFDYMINVDNIGDYIEPVDYEIISSGNNGNCLVDENGLMTYIPNQDFPYTNELTEPNDDLCSFKISDVVYESNESLISIEVIPVNDDPILSDIPPLTFIEDQILDYNLDASDVDQSDILTFNCLPSENISCEINGNILTLSASDDYFGTETILIEVFDDYGNTLEQHGTDFQEVSVTVEFQNDPPVLAQISNVKFNEDESIIIQVSASDPDPIVPHEFLCENSENISCELSSYQELPDSSYITNIEFTASENYNGKDSVLVKVKDDLNDLRLEDSQIVNIFVIPVNDAPITSSIDTTTSEDIPLSLNLSNFSNDVENDNLTYSIIEQAINGECILNESTGDLIYSPNENYPLSNDKNGTDSCSYIVFDGELESNISNINFEIERINDVPIISKINEETIEDNELIIDLKDYVFDVENDLLTYDLLLKGENGSCSFIGDGLVKYIPNPGFPIGHDDGFDTCSFKSNDGYGDSIEGIINIVVRPINDIPVLATINGPIYFKEDTISNPISVSATDEDQDELTFLCQQINIENFSPNIFCDVDGENITFYAAKHFNGTEFVNISVDDGWKGVDYQKVMVIVEQVYDPPKFIDLVPLEMNEEDSTSFTVNASDPDVDDQLTFSCSSLTNDTYCEIDDNFLENLDGTYSTNFTITASENFYGFTQIELIVDDGYNDRFSVRDTIQLEVKNIDDNPKIKSHSLTINNITTNISNNMVSFNEVETFDDVKFKFEISDPDSLNDPDSLFIFSEPMGMYYGESLDEYKNNSIKMNQNIDLSTACPITICNIDSLKNDNTYVVCDLDCNENFSGHFVQRFIINDSDNLKDTVDVNIEIKQVNDFPLSNIMLNDNLANYSKEIDLKLLDGPSIDSQIYFDQTKFYQDSVLTNSNPIPNEPNLDSLYIYLDNINSHVPSYYFIWERQKFISDFDPDCDSSLNQYPLDLFYRLEFLDGNDVYVIKDQINDSVFNGPYAYVLASIDPNLAYPLYNKNINDYYLPAKDSLVTSYLNKINGEKYTWRIVSQNYNMINNDKKQNDCTDYNEIWNLGTSLCEEYEKSEVIIMAESEQFTLDIQYSKGEYHFILNPLDIYLDHFDMYFIPDDELKQGDYNYLFSSYLNYNSSTQPLDQVFNLEYLGESDILKSVGSFNEFGVSDIFVFTVDKYDNTYLNITNLNYQPLNDNTNQVDSPSGNIQLQLEPGSFDGNSRILMYNTNLDQENIRNNHFIMDTFINITSNNEMKSNSLIHFDFSQYGELYNPNFIKVNHFDGDTFKELITFVDETNVSAQIEQLGGYILSYNVHDNPNIIYPENFGIKLCYPNPFNPIVTINYEVNEDSFIKMNIYNILGQKVNSIDYGFKTIGEHIAKWNGENSKGFKMPSGTYFIEITNNNLSSIKPVTLIK